jgi:hypothetical protein
MAGDALGGLVGDPLLGNQIALGVSGGSALLSNVAHQGSELTNTKNYAGQNSKQIQNNILERASNIKSTVSAGPNFA